MDGTSATQSSDRSARKVMAADRTGECGRPRGAVVAPLGEATVAVAAAVAAGAG
jgi:hypothetical protein